MALKRLSNGTYNIEFRLLGHRVHRSSRSTSAREARALEDQLRQEIREGTFGAPVQVVPTRMTLGEAVRRYVSQHLAPQSQSPHP